MHDPDTARRVLAALGLDDSPLEPVGDGFASDAWRIERPDGPAVLRVANARGLVGVTYPMEHALLAHLSAAGAPVPGPIAGSWEIDGWDGPAFSVTDWAPGRPLRSADHARAVPELVRFVRALRGVPVASGYGALVADADGTLRGAVADRGEAIARWAERPMWPLDGSRLADHPAIGEDPSLVERMDAHEARIHEALTTGPTAIIHTDLHEENVLDDDGSLTIIDMGEAFVGPRDWEIAAIGFFLDVATADAVVAILAEEDGSPVDAETTAAIGLAFGAYRWHLSREHAFDDDEHDRAYLETCLARLAALD